MDYKTCPHCGWFRYWQYGVVIHNGTDKRSERIVHVRIRVETKPAQIEEMTSLLCDGKRTKERA